MKITTITKSMLAAVLLMGSATILMAQTATAQTAKPTCPLGYEPGYGRSLSAEQRAQHRAAVQQLVAELRQKRTNGTITTEEQTWLQQVEQRGGMCINGTPRGCGAGRGPGAGNCARTRQGQGQGQGRGLRDGTGPRSLDGTCPISVPPR